MDWFMTGLGLVILLLAGDALVKGAVSLSLKLGVPALIVGLTIVAFGTSAPEMLIGIKAILEGSSGIALGNVVGSNTANILLVLGVPALVATMQTGKHDTRQSYLVMLAASVLFIGACALGPITWPHGLVLITTLFAILGWQVRQVRAHRAEAEAAPVPAELEEADPTMPTWQIAGFLAAGLIGLPIGADLLVAGATKIALDFGVSETVIGLTLVAVGTSLPELATTFAAAVRRHAEVAIGNVIGSNMFNVLAIIGVTALVGPIQVDAHFLTFDLWVMLAASLLLAPFVFLRWNITRGAGVALSACYAAYIFVVLT